MRRIILAGAGSGNGKTVITCGLLKSLMKKGYRVNSYKCGPDYIDPMFHKSVLGITSENIDTFFSDEEHIRKLLSYGKDYDISVIEGVMGIYDGLGGLSPEGSAYDLAAKTGTSIILVFNAKGMGRTMISQLKGIIADDHEKLIKGIILNQISAGYYETIAPLIEQETQVKIVGFVKDIKGLNIESRHLGLKKPEEIEDLDVQLEMLSKEMCESMDFESIIEISDAEDISEGLTVKDEAGMKMQSDKPVLAVAYDEAFCFYYEENLRLLKEAGADIVYFSPLRDEKLPEGVSGLLIGGGYPELKLEELEKNETMRKSIRVALEDGMPCLAECGGFMYLHDAITGDAGKDYEMVGVVKGKCYNTGKLCRFGYVEVSGNGIAAKGHEFHYYDSNANGSDMTAKKPVTKKEWKFGYADENRLWGYPHLYYASCMEIPEKFVKRMIEYKAK